MLSKAKTHLTSVVESKFGAWLSKRMPANERHILSQKSIFILPSKFGLAYVCFTMLIFVLGTNYQNNLILLLSYLFSSLFITTMLYCFLNMAGLSISAKGRYFTFCDEDILIPIVVSSERNRHNFTFCFTGHKSVDIDELNIEHQVHVPVVYKIRGEKKLPRLRVSTEFPFGLFHCWTNIEFEIEAIVSPKPVACRMPADNSSGHNDQEQNTADVDTRSTSGDFYELRPYKKGESLKQVAWKQLAKTGNWMVSQHHIELSDAVTLNLDDMPASQLEVRLQHLCYLVLEHHYANTEFGLKLGANKIGPASGQKHLNSCLIAMATYE